MENIKIKFKKSGIIMEIPVYMDGNILRCKETHTSYPWNERDWNALYLQWIRGEISDEELVISRAISGVSVYFLEATYSWEGNLDIIEIINYDEIMGKMVDK